MGQADKLLRRIHLISRETEVESSHVSGQLIYNGQQNVCLHTVYSEWDYHVSSCMVTVPSVIYK